MRVIFQVRGNEPPQFSSFIMGKDSLCPGCKHKFQNGRPYSMHIKSCREVNSAVDTTLKKHKILIAKKEKEKAASIAAHRDLAAQASQMFPDDHEMDVDSVMIE
jgi:hypothetical protein